MVITIIIERPGNRIFLILILHLLFNYFKYNNYIRARISYIYIYIRARKYNNYICARMNAPPRPGAASRAYNYYIIIIKYYRAPGPAWALPGALI